VRGSGCMSTGSGWGAAPRPKTKQASQSGGLGVLFYFFCEEALGKVH